MFGYHETIGADCLLCTFATTIRIDTARVDCVCNRNTDDLVQLSPFIVPWYYQHVSLSKMVIIKKPVVLTQVRQCYWGFFDYKYVTT